MKKALIALGTIVIILIALVGGLIVAEQRAKASLEADVAEYLDSCAITPDRVDVHGRPYLVYAAQHTADLTYVDLEPAKGTNKDQVLVHHLVDGHADRLTRFITFDYPSGTVRPVKNADDSYTEVAEIDGEEVTFSARTDPSDDGTRLDVLANGRQHARFTLPRTAEVRAVSAGDDGVIVEIEYADPNCR
ncbi:hypothetical protein SAMN04489752_1493 [Brevibacterium siliguriense]|uniref:Uncharacterized protein n=1 Tax=Brevibacterium siliguriense TaxID=1136497 RepID=A0A1H1RDV9_9MICO|nr:hypothetical protein [Brevibacterium siliguriense]SDS33878.1 hypothetical protein SAMN04489752_1493 [Brevibacterium siliguriense]